MAPSIHQPRQLMLVALIALAPLEGCRQAASPATAPKSGFLAFVGAGEDDPIWPVLRATAQRVHFELGLTTLPLVCAAPPTFSVNAQRTLLRRLHGEGMTALCVQVTHPEGIAGTLDALAARGVRIVTMMEPVRSKVPFVHAGPDDAAIGRALADALRETLKGKGTAAVLHADSIDEASVRRHRAFTDRIESFRSVAVLFDRDCRADPRQAREMIAETMKRYPNLGAWVVMDNWPLRGPTDDGKASTATSPPTCPLIGVDPTPAEWAAMENGTVAAMVASRYDRIAAHAMTTCASLALGEAKLPTSFTSDVRTIHRDDLADYKEQWQKWTSPNPDNAP